MKKSLVIATVGLAFSSFLPSTKVEASVGTREATIQDEAQPQYETRAYSHHYRKTITRYYSNTYSIPTYSYYSEYNSSFGSTFSGNLVLTGVRYSNGGWVATYSGQLSGFWR